jgi:hypothetical protein
MKGQLQEIIDTHKDGNLLILANGPTGMFDMSEYWKKSGGYIWTINGNWRNHPYSNLGWVMDDWDSPAHDIDNCTRQEKREALVESPIPIMHPREIEEFPKFIRYPLEDIISTFQIPYFGETTSYMVAFAIYCGVKRIDFRGTDYHGCKPAERACTEGWTFLAKASGIEVHTDPKSHFMKTQLDGKNNHIEFFYGYVKEHFPYDFVVREGDVPMLVPKGDNEPF